MPVTAVRNAVSPGHARPSGPKVCAQSAHWYAFFVGLHDRGYATSGCRSNPRIPLEHAWVGSVRGRCGWPMRMDRGPAEQGADLCPGGVTRPLCAVKGLLLLLSPTNRAWDGLVVPSASGCWGSVGDGRDNRLADQQPSGVAVLGGAAGDDHHQVQVGDDLDELAVPAVG